MKNRIVAFVLIVLILISILPQPLLAKGFVKEIHVIYNDFKLQLEGKNVSSKEIFVYDGELWLPLKDLGKALGMGVDFNLGKRTFKLNSNGKLKIDDGSKANIAFQRGYEIQAKERIIGDLDKEIREFEGKNVSEEPSSESVVRNIPVSFSNIDLFLDGKRIHLDIDPLIYNDDLYVSLVALSPHLYITPSLKGNLVDIDSNAVLLKKAGYNSADELAKFRDSLNNRLGIQLEKMEKRKEVLMDVKIPYEDISSLSAMEKYLNKHLGMISDLPINISLRAGSGNWYSIDIDFPSRYNYRWNKLSRRHVEAHIWDIFVAITNLYDGDAKIQGSIRNPYYSSNSKYKNYVSFDSKLKDIRFSFLNSNLDMSEKVDPIFIQELLKEKLGRYENVAFNYSAKLSGYDLDLLITPATNAYMKKWSPELQLKFLKEIDYEIKKHYPGLKINGRIEYPGEDTINFLIDNGQLSSSHMVNEMVKYLNDRYGSFNVNGLKIPMKYGFHKVDKDNYTLVVDMDFHKNNPKWNLSSEEALGSFLQDVIKEIISLWDVNIFAQVYDKDQSLVSEFVVSQDTVQAVTANPLSGNIEEGKTVSLYTNTPDAEIYYTNDGTDPSTNNRIKYTGPIIINKDSLIKAYALKDGFKDSPIYEFKYTIVAAGNIASGLDGLKLSQGSLEPSFNKYEYDYKINVDSSVSTIGFTPTASSGSILIDGVEILSGETKDVDLAFGETKVKIQHRETGKLDRSYTIVIKRIEADSSDVRLRDNYVFKTSVVGIFNGQLAGSTTDFSQYKLRLIYSSKTDTISVDKDGYFEHSGFSIDFWDKYMGYEYEVVLDGIVIDSGSLDKKE